MENFKRERRQVLAFLEEIYFLTKKCLLKEKDAEDIVPSINTPP